MKLNTNFEQKWQNSPKLPRVHVELYCNADVSKVIREKGYSVINAFHLRYSQFLPLCFFYCKLVWNVVKFIPFFVGSHDLGKTAVGESGTWLFTYPENIINWFKNGLYWLSLVSHSISD